MFYEGLRLWEVHLYVFYEDLKLWEVVFLTKLCGQVGPLKKDPHGRGGRVGEGVGGSICRVLRGSEALGGSFVRVLRVGEALGGSDV